jgi:hypothetical protein
MAATWTIEGETACLRQRDIFSNPPILADNIDIPLFMTLVEQP